MLDRPESRTIPIALRPPRPEQPGTFIDGQLAALKIQPDDTVSLSVSPTTPRRRWSASSSDSPTDEKSAPATLTRESLSQLPRSPFARRESSESQSSRRSHFGELEPGTMSAFWAGALPPSELHERLSIASTDSSLLGTSPKHTVSREILLGADSSALHARRRVVQLQRDHQIRSDAEAHFAKLLTPADLERFFTSQISSLPAR